MAKRWYVVHVYSGFEKKIAQQIKEQAAQKGLADQFEEVLVPTEQVIEVRRGQKVNTEHKFFPGYVLVKMELTDDAWHLVKNTPKVTGFLGSKTKPSPISEAEADRIMKQNAGGCGARLGRRCCSRSASRCGWPMVRSPASTARWRRWTRTRARLKVSVSIFGRSTPVELEYGQVEKV